MPIVKLSLIKEIRAGQETKNFLSTEGRFADVKDLSFSIIYAETYETVDIVCQNAHDYVVWAKGLKLNSTFAASNDLRRG